MKSALAASVKERFERMQGSLNERARRLFAATEALASGWGGVAIVARATCIAPSTIGVGKAEVRGLEESWRTAAADRPQSSFRGRAQEARGQGPDAAVGPRAARRACDPR